MSTPVDAASVPAGPTPVAELTGRLEAGDEEAWRSFHAAYHPRLLRYLLVVAGGREALAVDAAQAAFLRAVKHMRRFDAEPELWSWLTVLARTALVDELRRERRRAGLLDQLLRREPEPIAAEESAARDRLLRWIQEGMAELAPEDRELLARKYEHGVSVRDLAGELATTEKGVESRLVRIRRRLRESIRRRLARGDEGSEP